MKRVVCYFMHDASSVRSRNRMQSKAKVVPSKSALIQTGMEARFYGTKLIAVNEWILGRVSGIITNLAKVRAWNRDNRTHSLILLVGDNNLDYSNPRFFETPDSLKQILHFFLSS